MISTRSQFFFQKYKESALKIHCLILLMKHLLLIRTLKIKPVLLSEKIVIQDSEIEILWQASGCHKIVIRDIGVIPGNIHGVRLLFSNRINPIEIIFYGIANKVHKRISIPCTKICLMNKFFASTNLAVPSETNHIQNEINVAKHLSQLDTKLGSISVGFEPFDMNNYH
jgi:hypothetical protein